METKDESSTQNSGTGDAGAGGGGGAAGAAGGAGDGGAGGAAERFDAKWSEDLRTHAGIAKAKTAEDVARMFVNAEKRLGVPADQLIRLPTKADEFKDVYAKLGAPEKADGYKIDLGENATDADKALAGKFAEAMFGKGPYPQSFITDALGWWTAANAEHVAAIDAKILADREAGDALLKKEFGAAYDQTVKAIGDAINTYGDKELQKELDATGLGDNPRLTLMLAKMIQRMNEGEGAGGGKPNLGGEQLTPDQARAARMALEADPVKGVALRDPNHAMHKTVVEERRKLFRFENPDGTRR